MAKECRSKDKLIRKFHGQWYSLAKSSKSWDVIIKYVKKVRAVPELRYRTIKIRNCFYVYTRTVETKVQKHTKKM